MTIEAKFTNPKSDLEKQKAYADSLEKKGFNYGFAVGTAFVESMRNTHYKHTGTALDELIDNSIEAGATQVSIALGYNNGSTAKPDALAVIDDGHGMPKGMLRPAAAWGGTHRHDEKSRTGFGRFGFGLPSASVNQARRFSIFSKVNKDVWRSVTIDLDEIADGKYNNNGIVQVPAEQENTSPPKWVMDHIAQHMPGGKLSNGSVVVWEKMDRIKWGTTKGMRDNLLQHFGVTFRNYLRQTVIKVVSSVVV
jgi:Histidine kinase-, DNA gyrase B-, and HSP90-like ATPase